MSEPLQAARSVRLDSLAEIDPEALRESTSPRHRFKYVDISCASNGRLALPSDFIEFSDAPSRARKMLRNGDLVVSTVRPNLKAFAYCRLAEGPYIASTGFAVLRAKENVDAYFLLSALLSDDLSKQIESHAVGSNYPAINSSDIRRLQVPAFDSNTQRAIGKILGTIDTAIEQTEALIEKYQHIKAGLMHDLFTRGVLPTGQLRPPREHAPELYQETTMGWIPREWPVAAARSLCSLITKGTTPAAHEMWQDGDGVRFLRVDNLTFDGQLTYEASSFRIAEKTHLGNLARSRCLPGDVLTNIVGPPLGKVGLVTAQTGELNINQAIAVFRPIEALSSVFLLRWLTTETVKRWFLQRAKQTSGQLNLTLAMCQDLPIPLVGRAEQSLILERSQSCEKLIQSEIDKLRLLKTQKLGLMQDLLTGKVSVTPVAAQEIATP